MGGAALSSEIVKVSLSSSLSYNEWTYHIMHTLVYTVNIPMDLRVAVVSSLLVPHSLGLHHLEACFDQFSQQQ